jgi:hypothetical protein
LYDPVPEVTLPGQAHAILIWPGTFSYGSNEGTGAHLLAARLFCPFQTGDPPLGNGVGDGGGGASSRVEEEAGLPPRRNRYRRRGRNPELAQ